MRASYTAFLVCVIVGMFGVIYFDSSRDVISSYLHSIINKFKKCEMHPPLSDEEGYLDNNTWRILWYDIPFYLKKAVTYFEMRVQKCENVSLQCIISTNNSEIMRSNVVVFSESTLPKCPPMKRTSQTWCFNTMENGDFTTWPTDVWENSFDWIMSYRRDAHVSRPYGKILRLDKSNDRNYSDVFRKKTKFGVWMSSHCPTPSRREEYITQLQKHIQVDTFGKCGRKMCGVQNPNMNDCLKNFARDYKFYFSFENNICRDYSTEKVFNLYEHNLSLIPVVNGPPQVTEYLPKGTFLNALEFASPESLAKKLTEIGSSENLYTQYLKEKDKYFSLNGLDIFQESMCTICRKLDHMEGIKRPIKASNAHVMKMYRSEC